MAKKVREPLTEPIAGKSFCARDVGNMERAMLAHPAKCGPINTDLDAARYGYGTKMSPRNHNVPFAESQRHIIDPANPRGALDDCIEHRLHVRRRAADDAEHFRGCRLMLQRLAQFRVAFLSSLNNRTFSIAMTAWSAKVLSSADLLLRRTDGLPVGESESPRWNALSEQWRGKHCSSSPCFCSDWLSGNSASTSASEVMDVNCLPVDTRLGRVPSRD